MSAITTSTGSQVGMSETTFWRQVGQLPVGVCPITCSSASQPTAAKVAAHIVRMLSRLQQAMGAPQSCRTSSRAQHLLALWLGGRRAFDEQLTMRLIPCFERLAVTSSGICAGAPFLRCRPETTDGSEVGPVQ